MKARRPSFNNLGWQMTADQQRLYFALWNKACIHQGWDKLTSKEREEKRREIMAEVFDGPKSAKDVNRHAEFDAIKAKFLQLSDSVQGTRETDHPDIGEKRRLLKVVAYQKRLIRVYREPEAYVTKILKDGPKIFKGISTIEDLSAFSPQVKNELTGKIEKKPSQLMKLVFTLTARVNSLRNEAGHTIHDMKMVARVKCDCAQCLKYGQPTATQDDVDAFPEEAPNLEPREAELEEDPF